MTGISLTFQHVFPILLIRDIAVVLRELILLLNIRNPWILLHRISNAAMFFSLTTWDAIKQHYYENSLCD